ncbi:MAG: hypothetical protein AW07_03549 [Candidatus Accumulibacter sp. SK-11]|nr:MAG: hypothetical protein AW07_03549 [Candidatus Accumulibacter sp. SK-11]
MITRGGSLLTARLFGFTVCEAASCPCSRSSDMLAIAAGRALCNWLR